MLKYALRKNQLTPQSTEYTARVTDARSHSREEIIERLTKRGSAMTKTDMQSVLTMHDEEVADIIAHGGTVNTPLFNISYSITGLFKNLGDSFDNARHSVHVKISPGTLLREALRKLKTEKVEASHTEPAIGEVFDVVSGMVNSLVTRGGVFRITGNRLKFDAADEEQGVFLLAETGEIERCTVIVDNMPARVTVMVPVALAEDTVYSLEIRTRLDSSNKTIKYLKTGRLDAPLRVAVAGKTEGESVQTD